MQEKDGIAVHLDNKLVNITGSWAKAWQEHQYEMVRLYQISRVITQLREER